MIAIQRRAVVDEYKQFSFARNSVAFGSNGRLYYPHQARFETVSGRTGVLVEEGATNLLGAKGILDTDSNRDGVADGWTVYATGSATGTRRMDAANATFGRALCQRIERTGGASGDRFGISTSVTGVSTPNNISVLVKVASLDPGAAVTLYADYLRSDNTWVEFRSVQLTAPTDWVWVELPASSNPTAARANILIRIEGGNGVVYVQAVQSENKAYHTSFTNGTRAAETLTVPTAGVLYPQEGTIEAWVYVDDRIRRSNTFQTLFSTKGTGQFQQPKHLWLCHNGYNNWWSFFIYDDSGNTSGEIWTADDLSIGWHLLTCRWSPAEASLWIDGVKKNYKTSPLLPTSFDATAYIGSRAVGQYSNTLIGPLRISRRARTDQEIADAYAAGTLTADADTTLLLPFTGPDVQRSARVLYVPAVGF